MNNDFVLVFRTIARSIGADAQKRFQPQNLPF